ncbi:hypothetical protein ACE017_18735 [Shewanella mangrovisoli]|uniref:hypothetical protein n=1 Tax=Shewanella mangrovisoli TaxID=2864211 RepID=UPI0035BB91F6
MLRLRLSTEHHYAFKPSPCLKRVEFPLNEQIFNTIGISSVSTSAMNNRHKKADLRMGRLNRVVV